MRVCCGRAIGVGLVGGEEGSQGGFTFVQALPREGGRLAQAIERAPLRGVGVQNLVPLGERLREPAAFKVQRSEPFVSVWTVPIKTGRRRILSYLFSPILQVTTTALRER